ncbi:MAG: thioredoxin family protein [Marmoricola sp.]
MSAGLWILIVAVVVATVFGLWRAATDGRLKGTHRVHGLDTPPSAALDQRKDSTSEPARPWSDQLGERATLVQFSSAFCAPCRTTRHVLADVAESTPGVSHVEIDAEHHLELVRELGIFRTPTTLILGAGGDEIARATGVPRKPQVLATLDAVD